jgi:signal peptidase II
MLYFPVIRGYWPEWFPFWGGQTLVFFRPVFNIADSSITIGVFIILFFQKRFFAESEIKKEVEPASEETTELAS